MLSAACAKPENAAGDFVANIDTDGSEILLRFRRRSSPPSYAA
jgi:hypothetical protein